MFLSVLDGGNASVYDLTSDDADAQLPFLSHGQSISTEMLEQDSGSLSLCLSMATSLRSDAQMI